MLANSALGGSSTARLFQEVRVRRALSYGANSGLPSYRDEGLLVALAQTRNNAAPEVAQVMMAEIRRMRDEPIAADVLNKRRTLLVGAFGRQVETTNGLGNFLAGLAVQGLPMSDYRPLHPEPAGGDAGAGHRLGRRRDRPGAGEHRHRRPGERVPRGAARAASERGGDPDRELDFGSPSLRATTR